MSKFGIYVFLSYNTKDGPVVKEIALRLRDEFGLGIWFDSWNMIPGEPLQEQIEIGLKNCEATVIFIGKAGFGKWQNEEMRMAVAKRVAIPPLEFLLFGCQLLQKRKTNRRRNAMNIDKQVIRSKFVADDTEKLSVKRKFQYKLEMIEHQTT